MADFSDRAKGLEEEYFHRKNQELIEKLRSKMAVSEQAKASGKSSMKCPRCDGSLEESQFEGVAIDTCDTCGGVWLDCGELGQLAKNAESSGWWSRFRKTWNPE